MTANDLLKTTSNHIISKIQNHQGLNQFAIERSKFEGWLKVELIEALCLNNFNAKPEIERIDITFENTAIELKTINTNYRFSEIINKTRPITKNIHGIIKDIIDLQGKDFKNKFVIFIVFPIQKEQPEWNLHISKVEENLTELVFKEFKFNNGSPGMIYYGKV